MRNYFYSTFLALALITACAVSQTGSYPSSNSPSKQPQSGTTKTPDASQSTSPSTPQSDQAAGMDDQTLQSKIQEQLATKPALANVTVTVKDGVATLEGKVASKQDRKDAKRLAESVPGVKTVKDKLSVETSGKTGDSAMNPASPPSSHWMAPQSTGSSNGSSSATTPQSSTAAPSAASSGSASQRTSAASGSAQSSTQTGSGTPQSGAGTGSQSSTQSGSATGNGMPQSDANAGSTDNGTLQNQIQVAIKNEPTLSADAIVVTVTDNAIDLSGTAATSKEKQTAKRIAQSYANNRKVQDHITVSSSGSNSMPQSDKTDNTTPHNPDKKDRNSSQNPPDQTVPH